MKYLLNRKLFELFELFDKKVRNYSLFDNVCLFVCIAAKPQVMGPGLTNERTLSAVPSRILINSIRCDTTLVANSCNQQFSLEGDITLGGHPSKY
jgi:hypothetical protein